MRTYPQIETPAAVVDLDRLEANLERMQHYADAHGLGLRPHIKTHKALWLAEEQVRRGAIGLTVATPVEAERIGQAAPEVLVAYPPVGPRASAVLRSTARERTLVGLDSTAAVRSLQRALAETAASDASASDAAASDASADPIGVLVEVDVGMGRCGVRTPAEVAEVARACGDGVAYEGVMFYPGHIRAPVDEQDRELEELAGTLATLVDALGQAGLEPGIVSGGSTPTAYRSHEIPHQTEIRPGTYVFNDRTTAAMGACAWDDCAFTILATVVSTAVPGQAVVDAGTKALSSEGMRAPGYDGFGQLLDRPDVTVARKSEEHGILDLSRTDWRPAVGDRVRILPNHVCVTVNLHPRVYGVRGPHIERKWPVEARGWY